MAMVMTKTNLTKSTHISRTMLKTYWRGKLQEILCQPKLLRFIEHDGDVLCFHIVSWDEYWGKVPEACMSTLNMLAIVWKKHIQSGFSKKYAAQYGQAMLNLLDAALENHVSQNSSSDFLQRVLGFENISFKHPNQKTPFAAITTNFRNPFYVLHDAKGINIGSRSLPKMLPLLMSYEQGNSHLFYHYRKQRILKNDTNCLLYYLAVDPNERTESFCGLDALTESLVEPWDSRVEERAHLIGDKTVSPLLASIEKGESPLRILDIGSGDGLFTDKIITKVAESGVVADRKIELSLLDIVAGLPGRQSGSEALLNTLSRVERISSDYQAWLAGSKDRCDVVFLFRMLHNVSRFDVQPVAVSEVKCVKVNQYPLLPYMSPYYQTLSGIFPHLLSSNEIGTQEGVYHPFRIFEQNSLVMPDQSSMIEHLCAIADFILIEDSDLNPEALIHHLKDFKLHGITVHDFSRRLRLISNHVYLLTKIDCELPFKTEVLWPQ